MNKHKLTDKEINRVIECIVIQQDNRDHGIVRKLKVLFKRYIPPIQCVGSD